MPRTRGLKASVFARLGVRGFGSVTIFESRLIVRMPNLGQKAAPGLGWSSRSILPICILMKLNRSDYRLIVFAGLCAACVMGLLILKRNPAKEKLVVIGHLEALAPQATEASDMIYSGDTVHAPENRAVTLRLVGGKHVTIQPKSRVSLHRTHRGEIEVEILSGDLDSVSPDIVVSRASDVAFRAPPPRPDAGLAGVVNLPPSERPPKP